MLETENFELPADAKIAIQAQTTTLLRVYFSLDKKGKEEFLERMKLQMSNIATQTGQSYEDLVQEAKLERDFALKSTQEEGAAVGGMVGAVVGAAWGFVAVGTTVAVVAGTGGGAALGMFIGIMMAQK